MVSRGWRFAGIFALLITFASQVFAADSVIGLTNETFIQFLVTQAGSSSTVSDAGPLIAENCNADNTSFDPVASETPVDANDVPIQNIYFEWTGGTGYTVLIGTCSVANSGQTNYFSFAIPIEFEQAGSSNKMPVTAQILPSSTALPSSCQVKTNYGVVNSQTPSIATVQENLSIFALENPSESGLSANQIPAVGIDIQGLYNGFTVNKWAYGSGGCCGGAPFLIRVMCSTLAHFQTNA
jgi:hypothetical protein